MLKGETPDFLVIAGGIGRRALELFAQHHIPVCPGTAGTRIEVLAAACLDGQLTGSPKACEHHGHQHDHKPGHHDDHDGKCS